MNFLPVVDNNDLNHLKNMMENFNCSLYQNNSEVELSDFADIQNIMKEGRTGDLITLVRNILQYNFNICANSNNVKVFDSSFIKFFQASQFIINFLLYWKSEINKENMKLKNQFQELDKSRKECLAKKLEVRDLKKQLFKFQRGNNSENTEVHISECSQCKKLFINSTFLNAHCKRRHADQPFNDTDSKNVIQKLQNEIQNISLEENQTEDIQNRPKEQYKNDPNQLKMRLIPEMSCLEAQEKFWRGKIKNMSDKLVHENEKIKNLLNETIAENETLKKKIKNIERMSPVCSSVAVQTDFNLSKVHNIFEILRNRNIPLETMHHLQNKFESQSNNTSDRCKPMTKLIITDSSDISNKSLVDVPRTNFNSISSLPQYENDKSRNDAEIMHMPSPSPRKSIIFAKNNLTEYYCGTLQKPDPIDDIANKFHSKSSIAGLYEYQTYDENSPRFVETRSITSAVENIKKKHHFDDDAVQNELFFAEDNEMKNFETDNRNETKSIFNEDLKTECLDGEKSTNIMQNEDIKKIITKLFVSDNVPKTEEFADKLVKFYEKRRSLIPDIDTEIENVNVNYEKNDFNSSQSKVHEDVLNSKHVTVEDEAIKKETYPIIKNIQPDLKSQLSNLSNKDKHKLVHTFRNFQAKVMKNCSKAKKTCTDLFEEKLKRKLTTTRLPNANKKCVTDNNEQEETDCNDISKENELSYDLNDKVIEICEDTNGFPEVNDVSKTKPKLTSVLKKSKSTGNIAKKVAFSENLPTLKTISETNLREVHCSKQEHTGSIYVHFDKFAKPVPAPRAKKNIIIVSSTDPESPNK